VNQPCDYYICVGFNPHKSDDKYCVTGYVPAEVGKRSVGTLFGNNYSQLFAEMRDNILRWAKKSEKAAPPRSETVDEPVVVTAVLGLGEHSTMALNVEQLAIADAAAAAGRPVSVLFAGFRDRPEPIVWSDWLRMPDKRELGKEYAVWAKPAAVLSGTYK
jgi:hypothetical protein